MAEIKYLANIDLSKNQILNAVVQNLAAAPSSPVAGQIYYDTVDDTVYLYDGATWLDLSASGVTNLSFTRNGTTVTVSSDTGTDAILPVASTSLAGVMSATDKTKLDGVATGAEVNVATNLTEGTTTNTTVDVNSSTGTNATLAAASTSRAGLMTKAKFDEVEVNNTKVSDINHNVTTNLSTTTTATTNTVVSSDGTNAVLPAATTSVAGVMTGADKTKLDGIETSADVTDATNVAAAGAVMESDTSTASMDFVIDEDNMVSDSATKIPTQQSVKAYVDGITAANDAMVFKGTIGTGGTLTLAAFNALVVYDAGWSYKVITAGTYKGVVAEIGDLFIATVDRASAGVDADWTVAQTNIDGAVVGPASASNNNVAFFDGASGKLIKDSGLALSGSNTGDNAVNSLYSGLVSDTGVPAILSSGSVPSLNTGITEAEVKTILSLENVDNTTDASKPVSTAQQTALNLKANIASPTLTGVPAAPTASTGTNTTQIATTAYVKNQGYSTTTGTVKKVQVDCAAATSTTVTHSLGQYVNVDVYRKLTPFDKVEAQVTSTNATTVVVSFNVAPTLGEYVIVVQG
jgi:hypothetical protein